MDRIFFLGGLTSVIGGFAVILYQGIMFLKYGVWTSYTIVNAIDSLSDSLGQSIAANPAVMDALQKCPLSAFLIVFGLILLWVASKLRDRYA